MGLANDCLFLDQELRASRAIWEPRWKEVASLTMPFAQRFVPYGAGIGTHNSRYNNGPRSTETAPKIFDATPVWAVDRLTSGIISLTIPQAQKWHELALDDPLAPESSDEESEWFERTRDHLFAIRYDAKSSFGTAMLRGVRSMVGLGTGIIMIDERIEGGSSNPISYRPLPLSETALGLNGYGDNDTLSRRFSLSAHAVATRWPDKVSDRVKNAANNDARRQDAVEILHCIKPRDAGQQNRLGVLGAAFESFTIEVETKQILNESGYFEFPAAVLYWHREEGSPYGESPAMSALSDIKMLNAAQKARLRSAGQYVDPPLAIPSKGVGNRLNLNPRAVNPGMVNDQGQVLVKPIITSPNPGFADQIVENARQSVRESLFINLFQVLVDSPDMTATEASIRANEKGELLAPVGSLIQTALATIVERELGILQRAAAFEPGSPLELPQSLENREFGVKFTSPLDRLRRQSEVLGIQRTIEMASQLAQIDPEVLDNVDTDEALRISQDIFGAPQSVLRTTDERDEKRAQKAETLAQQQQIEQAQQSAELVNETAPALENINALVGDAAA